MAGRMIKIRSSARAGRTANSTVTFRCRRQARKVPAIVLASAVHGVDKDICDCRRRIRVAWLSSPPRRTCSGAGCPARLHGGDTRAGERAAAAA